MQSNICSSRSPKDRNQIPSHGVTSQSPDDFLIDLHAAFPDALISSVRRAWHNLRNTMPSVDAFIDGLQQSGLKTFPALLRQNIDGLI